MIAEIEYLAIAIRLINIDTRAERTGSSQSMKPIHTKALDQEMSFIGSIGFV